MIVFFLLTLIVEVLGTVGGFGSSVFFVPLARVWMNLQAVLALTSILHSFSNISKLIIFGKSFDRFSVIWIGIPSTIFVIIGALLTKSLGSRTLDTVLAIFLIVLASLLLCFPRWKLSKTKLVTCTAGGIAGFLAGLVGTGGAIRGMALTAMNLEKNVFIATSAFIDTFVDVSRMIIYLSQGYLAPENYGYLPLLALTAVLGSLLGRAILTHVTQESFRVFVLIMILLTGVVSLVLGGNN